MSSATEYHLGLLKAKLAKYRAQLLEPSKSASSKGEGFDVMKSGDARVALIGFPSVGKVSDGQPGPWGVPAPGETQPPGAPHPSAASPAEWLPASASSQGTNFACMPLCPRAPGACWELGCGGWGALPLLAGELCALDRKGRKGGCSVGRYLSRAPGQGLEAGPREQNRQEAGREGPVLGLWRLTPAPLWSLPRPFLVSCKAHVSSLRGE